MQRFSNPRKVFREWAVPEDGVKSDQKPPVVRTPFTFFGIGNKN
jgi:hypothetical protein